jgi:hypothetical protein
MQARGLVLFEIGGSGFQKKGGTGPGSTRDQAASGSDRDRPAGMAQALKTPQSMPVVGAVRIFEAAAVGAGPWKWFHLAKIAERLQGGRGPSNRGLDFIEPGYLA